ncbi:MAG: RidA family protein [Chloroflexi bacterium]|nr:RidA family protein [Chloroflexota bacterium]
MMVVDKLEKMGLALPKPVVPVANYVGAVRSGNLLFVSGHGPTKGGRPAYTGKVGRDLTVEEGYAAARLTTLNCLSTINATLGDLDKVKRIVKLLVFVNSAEEFTEQPKVANGASDLLVSLFGESGKHARSAVGMYQLPSDIAVEVEMVVEVEEVEGGLSSP